MEKDMYGQDGGLEDVQGRVRKVKNDGWMDVRERTWKAKNKCRERASGGNASS